MTRPVRILTKEAAYKNKIRRFITLTLLLALFAIWMASSVYGLTTMYNESFDGGSTGWSGGTLDAGNEWFDTNNNWSTFTSPDLNLSSYTWVRLCWSGYAEASLTTHKIYWWEESGSTDNDHLVADSSSGMRWREEDGYTQSYTHGYTGWNQYCVEANATANTVEFIVNGTTRWNASSVAQNKSLGRDYWRISVGNLNGGSEYRIDNTTLQVQDSEASNEGYQIGTLTATLITPNQSGNVDKDSFFDFNISITCTGGNCGNVQAYLDPADYLIDPTSDGAFTGSTTAEEDYHTLIDHLFQNKTGNQSWTIVTTTHGTGLWIPKYTSSTSFDKMSTCGSGSIGQLSMDNNYLVTDEFSQVLQLVSMDDNESRMRWGLNTVKAINASSEGHGSLTEWCVSQQNGLINKTHVSDTASDADARIIDALFTCSANTDFSQSLRDDCYNYADAMTQDFVNKNFLTVSYESAVTGQTLTSIPCGGSNVCTDVTNSGFMYTGYYGDNAIALLKAYKRTGNKTYLEVANNATLFALQASGDSTVGYWNYSTNSFRAIEGVHHKWDGGTPLRPVCTNNCGGSWDYSDAPRLTSLGLYAYQLNRTTDSVPGWLDEYLNDWSRATRSSDGSACLTSNAYSIQYYTNGTCSGAPNSGYYETGLGSQLTYWTNQSLVSTYLNNALSGSHYTPSTKKWDTTGEFGVYRQAFPIRSYGVAMGLDSGSYTSYGSVKGLVSTTKGATPFYTTNNNPNSTCGDMVNNTCTVSWRVNATGSIGSSYQFFAYVTSNESTTAYTDTISLTIYDAATGYANFTMNDVLGIGDARYFSFDVYNSSNTKLSHYTADAIAAVQYEATGYSGSQTSWTTFATYSIGNKTLKNSITGVHGGTSTRHVRAQIQYTNGTTVTSNEVSGSGGSTSFNLLGWSEDEEVEYVYLQAYTTSSNVWNVDTVKYWVYEQGYKVVTLSPGTYYAVVNDSSWAITNNSFTVTSSETTDVTLTGYADPGILYVYVEDELTSEPITSAVSLSFAGSIEGYSKTITGGSAVYTGLVADTYTITYSADGYDTRQKQVTINSLGVHSVTLHLLNSSESDLITITVRDKYLNNIQGATVIAQRKNLTGTNYYEVESCVTDVNGECLQYLELYDTTYRFVVTYEGSTVKTTSDLEISSTSLLFIVDLQDNIFETIRSIDGVTGVITWDNSTSLFSFSYSDPNGVASKGCLEITSRKGGVTSLVNNQCTTSSSATLTYTVNQSSGVDEYTARGYMVTGFGEETLDNYTVVVSGLADQFGLWGLFLFGFLLVGTMMFVALWSPTVAVVSGSFAIGVAWWLGFINVGSAGIGGLLVLTIVVVVLLKT